MADKELIALLKRSVNEWNQWRIHNPDRQPDLRGADLSRANLTEANLRGAHLSGAHLSGADLSGTYLTEAHLTEAHLNGANLNGANLRGAHLGWGGLQETRVEGCSMRRTVLTEIDLSTVIGLDTINHQGPSILDLETVILPFGSSRERFLRGVGIRETMIEYYDAIYTQPIQFHSCFISYTQTDYTVAKKLYDDLQRAGIRCWFSPHNLQPGDYYRKRIDQAIQFQDKMILLLSQQSIESRWVEHEVTQALARENEENRIILFPLRLDELVMHTSEVWAQAIRRSRHIGDLTCWKDEQAYQQVLKQMIGDLKIPIAHQETKSWR